MQRRGPMMPDEGVMPSPDAVGMMQKPTGVASGISSPAMGGASQESEEDDESNASPEEQAMYHKFMENYLTIMYLGSTNEAGNQQPPAADGVVEEYFSGDLEPVEALANAAASTVKFLADSAEAAGKPIPGDVLMHAGTEVIEDLADLAGSKRVQFHDYTEEELQGAVFRALDIYRETEQGAGRLNMDEINNDFNSMMQADKEGRLNEMLPGIDDAAQRMPDPMAEGETPESEPEQPQPPPRGMGVRR